MAALSSYRCKRQASGSCQGLNSVTGTESSGRNLPYLPALQSSLRRYPILEHFVCSDVFSIALYSQNSHSIDDNIPEALTHDYITMN